MEFGYWNLFVSCFLVIGYSFKLLPKENRLKKKKDFEAVTKNGKALGSAFSVLKFLKNDLAASRIGFVVSKKISNKAVVRNKVKRQLREAVRANLLHLKPGYDLVFFTKQGIGQRDFQEIQEAVGGLLAKANLLNLNKK